MKEKGLKLDFNIDSKLPEMLLTDPIRIHQVINNLVGNAIKFTDEGTITVTADLIRRNEKMVQVIFSIADNGIGMSEDSIRRLFEPFEQASTGFKRSHQGAGLGLAITKKIVDLMNGSILIDSIEGHGTTVYVKIPFQAVDSFQKKKTQNTKALKINNLKCLVADDDYISQLVIKTVLEEMGFDVFCVDDGGKVIEEIGRKKYDIIFMDIQMPQLDGVETTKRIREGQAGDLNKNIKIIAVTAYTMNGDKDKFILSGVDDYISKPIDQKEIRIALEKLFSEMQN